MKFSEKAYKSRRYVESLGLKNEAINPQSEASPVGLNHAV